MTKTSKNEEFSLRLVGILQKLNDGEILDIDQLAQEYQASVRTIQRDLRERLSFLPLEQLDSRRYRLDASYLGNLTMTDIRRFANFACISPLFNKIDRAFFSQYLLDSIQIKTVHYEPISGKQAEFDLLNQAIQRAQKVRFGYQRVRAQAGDKSYTFEVEPYRLVNKTGIWYLVGIHKDKVKVFSVTRISMPEILPETFCPDVEILARIDTGDGIYYEGVMDEVMLKVSSEMAVYFLRRNILPNQELVREMTDGTLFIVCKKVHEQEILPLVRYWIPHIEIVSPDAMKTKLMQQLQEYVLQPTVDKENNRG